jgi:hypothetical protein
MAASIFLQKIPAFISHNVPAVYDVFAVAIKECGAFLHPQKCGGEKPHQGRSPTAVFRSPSRPQGGDAYTVLLGAVRYFLLPYTSLQLFFSSYLLTIIFLLASICQL